MRFCSDSDILEGLCKKYGKALILNEVAKVNDDDPMVYVGTYAKYNEGSLDGEWVNLTDFSNYDDFIKYCFELHNDEDDPELMFQDYMNIPESMIDESSINPEFWDVMPLYNEYGIEFINDVMHDCGLSDFDELQDALDNMYVVYTDSVLYAVQMNCDETSMTDNLEWCERYFDYDAFGRSLRYEFIDYEVEDIDDEDEREERREELESMSDTKLAKYYINDLIGGSLVEAVGEENLSKYIDYEAVYRDMDCDIIESQINGKDVVAFIYR